MQRRTRAVLTALSVLVASPVHADINADADQAIRAYNEEGDLIAVLPVIEKAAKGGYPPAQAMYAYILDKAEENVLAVQWFRKAAEAGNAEGMFGLASMYSSGEGFAKPDFAQAGQWYIKAAEAGHVQAMEVVYNLYLQGRGVPQEPARAIEWMKKAATHGRESAARQLADIYARGLYGQPADPAQAQHWQAEYVRLAPTPTPVPRKR